MIREGIGLWMYRNQGGDSIQTQLKERLEKRGIMVRNDFDLRRCHVENGRILTEYGFDLASLVLLYHMNADEQSPFQLHILEGLNKAGVFLVNSYGAFCAASDKFMANLLMRKAKVRVPDSALFHGEIKKEIVRKLMSEWKQAVVKPRFSYGGKGILKFDNTNALLDFMAATKTFFVDFYLERFIPFVERDYRIELINHEYVGSYSRGLRHDYKTNMSAADLSSDGLFLKNGKDENQLLLATMAAKATGLQATIVDLVKSIEDDLYYVLEVNPMLGIFVQAANDVMGITPVTEDAYDDASDEIKLERLVHFLEDTYEWALNRSNDYRSHPHDS